MSSASDDDVGAIVDFAGTRSCYDVNTSSEEAGAMIDVEGVCYADYRVGQFAQGVIDFSSQYGSDYSISYTAPNITGRPTKYPNYGDFPETYAMRVYGEWWNKAPSAIMEIQPQNLPKVPAQDFIVVHFEDYTIPEKIVIFETFNPGAIVRIWAYTIIKTWICLWETGNDWIKNTCLPTEARTFSPPLKNIHLPTKIIRLEFNHTRLNYFTEIDAILLYGQNVSLRNLQHIVDNYFKRVNNGSIIRKLQSMQFRPDFTEDYQNQLQDFLTNDLNKFVNVLTLTDDTATKTTKAEQALTLNDMPYEILLKVFSYLDLVSLFRIGLVSKTFYEVSTHPLLYRELNLKPYWHLASIEFLCTLAKRATLLRKLDLSWCGLYNSISPTEFKKFIQQRGDNLTHLVLNSCKFLNASCIETIGIVCDNLKELSLRNCSTDPPLLNFSCLANLKNLERLDLFQTVIELDLLLTMLESNRKLKHLNLAFCGVNVSMDIVAQQIATYNQQLVSLDMWKSHYLSAVGLQALSNCHDLEEVDFGWCLREASLGDSLKNLIKNCPKLKKLFLATARGITDSDLQSIANMCKNLEQLDLMGILGVTKDRFYEILFRCTKLQLLDLSFCDNIDELEVKQWANTFKVNIKCSHVPMEYT